MSATREYIERRIAVADSGCWNWQLSKDPRGYGYAWSDRAEQAHRVSYRAFVGPIPVGMGVLHRCDNPSCCNPSHLFLGTQLDNMRDAAVKGRVRGHVSRGDDNPARRLPHRHPRGERHGNAKLTNLAVSAIRAELSAGGITFTDLAGRYGVSRQMIAMIARGKAWRHVS